MFYHNITRLCCQCAEAGRAKERLALDALVYTSYTIEMPKGELVVRGRYEWFKEKDEANVMKHGFSFGQILDVFDDPRFYEIYDSKHLGLGRTDISVLGVRTGFLLWR